MEVETFIAIAVGVGPILTVLLQKGADAFLKWKKAKEEHEQYEDRRITENYQYLIGKLEGQIENLRTEVEASRGEHLDCIRVQGELRGRIEELEKAFLRHDMANKQHVEKLAQEVEKVKTETKGGGD